jgi:hypothetical protein
MAQKGEGRAMRLHRLTLTGFVTLGILAGGLVFSGARASAATGYAYLGSFGSFEDLGDIAVDQGTGDVYAAYAAHEQREWLVSRFNASGQPEDFSALGTNALTHGFHFEERGRVQVAVDSSCSLHEPVLTGVACTEFDPANGDIYVGDTLHGVVDVFGSSGVYLGQLTGFGETGGVAVGDDGSVYVANKSEDVIDKYMPVANPVTDSDYVSQLAGVDDDCKLAVDSAGNVYAVGCPKPHEVRKYDPSQFGLPSATGTVIDSSPGWGVAVDPANGVVFVDEGSTVAQFSSAGLPAGPSFSAATIVGNSYGVAVRGATVYVADYGSEAGESGRVNVFEGGPAPPVPVTEAVRSITSDSATFSGRLGGLSSDFYFSYALGASCTGAGALTTSVDNGGSAGAAGASESSNVTGLQPNEQYTVCFAAKNRFGAEPGSPVGFTTGTLAPAVDGQSVSGVSREAVTLSARVNPENEDTYYYFQYGTSTSYTGGEVPLPAPGADIGAAFGDQSVSVALGSLEANTVYHWRVVASNATGTTYGADQTFLTLPFAPAVVSAPTTASVSGTGATLVGSVNPQGVQSGYFVQFGPSEAYGSVSAVADTAPGVSAVPVTVTLEGLRGGSTYHYRLVSQNSGGVTYGPDQTFTTLAAPPLVVTGVASAVTSSTATLSGSVDSQGTAASYEFDLGTDTSYGSRVFASAPAGEEVQSVAVDVGALQPGVTYHYRLVATNAFGTTYGADMVFTTPVVSAGVLVSPVAPALLTVPAIVFPAAVVSTVNQPKTKAKPKKKPRRRPKTKAKARSKAKAKAKATRKAKGAEVADGRGRGDGKGRRGR